jgi:hypothetical protein
MAQLLKQQQQERLHLQLMQHQQQLRQLQQAGLPQARQQEQQQRQGAEPPAPGSAQRRLEATLQAPEAAPGLSFWGWAAQPVTVAAAAGQPDVKAGSSIDPHHQLLPLHDHLFSSQGAPLFGSQGGQLFGSQGGGPVPLRLLHEQLLSSQDNGPVPLTTVASLSVELHKLYAAWQSGSVTFTDPPPDT